MILPASHFADSFADLATACFRVWHSQSAATLCLQITSLAAQGVVSPSLLSLETLYSVAVVGYSIFNSLDRSQIVKEQLEMAKQRYAHFKAQYDAPSLDDPRPLLLVVEAKHDHNGALAEDRRSLYYNLQTEYEIVFKTVANTEEFSHVLVESACYRKISALWINAHGNAKAIFLGVSPFSKGSSPLPYPCRRLASYLDGSLLTRPSLLRDLDESLNSSLADDATIILDSCETGSSLYYGENIAQQIAVVTKRRVFAPIDTITKSRVKVVQKQPFVIQFFTRQGEDGTFVSS